MSPALTRGQRVPTCFVLSKLLTTSDYKTRSLDLEWLLSILNTKVYQLHLDQMLEMLFIPFISVNEVCCLTSALLEYGIKRHVENAGVLQYLLNAPPDAILCFIPYFSLISVPFFLRILILRLLPRTCESSRGWTPNTLD